MMLVTWNCNMAFRKKQDQILRHDPDILVVQECENPFKKGNWQQFSDFCWLGENPNKGLGIFVRNGLRLQALQGVSSCPCRYALLAHVSGRGKNVRLLGIWAMDEPQDARRRYIAQVYCALRHYRPYLWPNSIVMGDFNGNAIWDERSYPKLYGNFTETAALLNEMGLASAYHSLRGCSFGEEAEPTMFLLKQKKRPYHLDYIFLPKQWLAGAADFWLGSYEEWIKFSDHVPLFLQLKC